MVTVRMVQMTVHQVVGVISVRHRLVSTIGTVFMALVVASAIMLRSTPRWVFSAHADLVFVNMVTMRVVKVPIVKIVVMTLVLYGHVSTVRTVYVIVPFVNLMFAAHFLLLGYLS